MKTYFLYIIFLCFIFSCSKDDTPNAVTTNANMSSACQNGFAGIYPCNGYDLIAHIPLENLSGFSSTGSDSWGWVDPSTQKEYAIFCSSKGVSFVDISEATNPIFVGSLNTQTVNNSWRDVKVYNNYAFVVSEAEAHGMQVFDLTHLREATNTPETFTPDAHYSGFGKAHNLVINETSGYAYAVGSDTFGGGPHFINIQNPTNPVGEGGYTNNGYSHDAQVVTYNGPDSDYTNKEILIGSNENEIVIVDITDKDNPNEISTIGYSNIGYTHQGWFTEDMTYFFLGDELDEIEYGTNTRTLVFDFSDLDNPSYFMDFTGASNAIDHNAYINGNTYYLANYTAGVRMFNISNIEANSVEEIGYFDTFPENNNTSFNGAWSVYPYFPSGNIIISDINRGLFIIKKSE